MPSAAAAAVDAYASPRDYRRAARPVADPGIVPSLREAALPPRAPRPRTRPRALPLGVRPRWPFFALLLVMLASGLIGLLVLNTALAQGAFRVHDLQKRADQLDSTEQGLAKQVDEQSDPAALARRAAALGLRPGNQPTFLRPGAPLPTSARIVRGADGQEVVVIPAATPSARARSTTPATPQHR